MNVALASDAVKPWRRLAASAIDLSLLIPLQLLLQQFLPQQQALTSLIILALIAAVTSWRLFAATPGMALMDCTLVLTTTGRTPSLQRLLMRLFGLIIATLPLGIGLLWIFKGPRHQGWQDTLSGTAIIKDDEGRKSLAQLEEEVR